MRVYTNPPGAPSAIGFWPPGGGEEEKEEGEWKKGASPEN